MTRWWRLATCCPSLVLLAPSNSTSLDCRVLVHDSFVRRGCSNFHRPDQKQQTNAQTQRQKTTTNTNTCWEVYRLNIIEGSEKSEGSGATSIMGLQFDLKIWSNHGHLFRTLPALRNMRLGNKDSASGLLSV